MVFGRRQFLFASAALLAACGASAKSGPEAPPAPVKPGFPLEPDPAKIEKLTKTPEEWKAVLEPQSYAVLREADTERAFSGRYWDNHAKGRYLCAGCGLALFDSEDKFESGTGWPSFTRPLKAERVAEIKDTAYGMVRTEVRCARCDGHLGHVFDDGPAPTHLRYCMNSVSLAFVSA